MAKIIRRAIPIGAIDELITPPDHNIDIQYVSIISSALKLARKNDIEHWSRSSKTISWSADSFQINHVTSMSWHMSPRYGHVILVSGYPVLKAVNWPLSQMSNIKDVDLPRHAWHPSLPFDGLPYSTRTICRRVRTYARSITWKPEEKRLTIFYEYGALSHAPLQIAQILKKGAAVGFQEMGEAKEFQEISVAKVKVKFLENTWRCQDSLLKSRRSVK